MNNPLDLVKGSILGSIRKEEDNPNLNSFEGYLVSTVLLMIWTIWLITNLQTTDGYWICKKLADPKVSFRLQIQFRFAVAARYSYTILVHMLPDSLVEVSRCNRLLPDEETLLLTRADGEGEARGFLVTIK